MDGWKVIFRHIVIPCSALYLIFGLSGLLLVHRPLIFAGVVALLALWLVVANIKAESVFRKKGYRAGHEGRDSIFYEERVGEQTRKLVIGGEMMVDAPHVVYVPSDTKWKQQMPDWAQERKAEILHRVKEELGTKGHEFVEN